MYLKLRSQEPYLERLAAESLNSLYFKASCQILIAALSSCRERITVQPRCSAGCSRGLQPRNVNSRSRWKRPSGRRKGSRYRSTPLLLPITGFWLALEIKGKWEKVIHLLQIQGIKKFYYKVMEKSGNFRSIREKSAKIVSEFYFENYKNNSFCTYFLHNVLHIEKKSLSKIVLFELFPHSFSL